MGIQTSDLIDALRALAAGDHGNGLLQMAGREAVISLAADRLAAYGDMGLEPQEIKSLQGEWNVMRLLVNDYSALGPIDYMRELAEAERDGRRVVLPCKIGDTAFVLETEDEDGGNDCIFEGNIVAIHIGTDGITVTIGHMEKKCWFSETERRISDLSVDWFLTRSEAEAALGGGGVGR